MKISKTHAITMGNTLSLFTMLINYSLIFPI